ncbi:MAG: bifunctional phosphopantothenoylcysteine decarboxylase/phosphopantothenate--cysteine ligase CoaBC [Clostridiales bacterium]|jgi:phosphopantothenoylcysteine decarboxylase/phosphopantothenate--cysteine ligase|nr:bifunctional phosphopantothenoylcysteine decarboxylase/phosphopantothenate--cysteine ligase CoaBC [Clostridiales bacterium]
MKNVVLGVTGCIAAYKACEIIGLLKKSGCTVDVILTSNAERFVSRLTFETLSGNAAAVDTFERPLKREIEHIALAKKADIFVIAPATANLIGKIANGIADDMLTTTVMASKAVKVLCPAMNTAMYENAAVRDNIERLKGYGYIIIEPEDGLLACGDIGKGRLADVGVITKEILRLLNVKQDYKGKRILVTAGATRENIDGVRYISNNSSGKMGVALADAAAERGAEVTLIEAYVKEAPSAVLKKIVTVGTTAEMYDAVIGGLNQNDIIIKAAAPSDYKVKGTYSGKIKSPTLTLELEKNKDIAAAVGRLKTNGQRLVIFSAETEDLIKNAEKKLKSKYADMVVANDVTIEGAGFDTDTNIVTIITSEGKKYEYPKMQKRTLADIILDRILELP